MSTDSISSMIRHLLHVLSILILLHMTSTLDIFGSSSLQAMDHTQHVLSLEIHHIALEDSGLQMRYGIYLHDPRIDAEHSDLLIFLLGRGEWIEKYGIVYKTLAHALQRDVLIIDYPGQGGSEGVRGHIDHYDEYVEALAFLLRTRFPQSHYAIIGHSMGGLIALYGTMSGKLASKKLLLSSPLLQMRDKPVPPALARPIAQTLSILGLGQIRVPIKNELHYPFEENRLTSNRTRFETSINTPFPIKSPSLGWIHATFQASSFIFDPQNLQQFTTPVTLFMSEHEHIVSRPGIEAWISEATTHSPAKVQWHYFAGAKHEIFFERKHIVEDALMLTVDFLQR